MSEKKTKIIEKTVFIFTLAVVVICVNFMFFNNWLPEITRESPDIKVEEIGNTVVLRYASASEEYYIEGIGENNQFVREDGLYVFQNPQYCVSQNGALYDIVNSSGEVVASVTLVRADEMEHNLIELDAATYSEGVFKVPYSCTQLRVYTSVQGGEQPISIQIEQRQTPVDIIFDGVSLTAPDMSPVLYSFSSAPVNLTVRGSVCMIGGANPYNAGNVSDMDRLLDTLDSAANAYCVVMISAVGTAASIYKGTEYYANMFKGVTGLQLITMENAWSKVEDLFNGRDGATGLDGIPAVQLQGDLNIVGENGASLLIRGGNGARGGNGQGGFIDTTKGGKGGNGASGLICNRLVSGLGYSLTVEAGYGGEGGEGGKNIAGEQGPYGNYGGSLESKVIISYTEITLND